MNAARPSDGLLGAGHTIKLLEHLAGNESGISHRTLCDEFVAIYSTSHSKTYNTITVLKEFELIENLHSSLLRIESSHLETADFFSAVQLATVNTFMSEIICQQRESCIRSDSNGALLALDSYLLPRSSDGSLLWLIEFSIVARARHSDRFWQINPEFDEEFLNCVKALNENFHSNGFALSTLKSKQAYNEIVGREAEMWVLKIEKHRLAKHRLVDQVRLVSDDDVAAGYDLVSFSSPSALVFDRFIEVKSYSEQPRFFWSDGEISKAKDLEENYVLMLVDRKRIGDLSYRPREINDPFRALFETQNNGWEFHATSFEFTKI